MLKNPVKSGLPSAVRGMELDAGAATAVWAEPSAGAHDRQAAAPIAATREGGEMRYFMGYSCSFEKWAAGGLQIRAFMRNALHGKGSGERAYVEDGMESRVGSIGLAQSDGHRMSGLVRNVPCIRGTHENRSEEHTS